MEGGKAAARRLERSSIKPVFDFSEMLRTNPGLFWGSVELFLQKPVSDISLFLQRMLEASRDVLRQCFNFFCEKPAGFSHD
jgi:hypothetical protein